MRRAFYIVHEYWETISELEHDCLPKAISVCARIKVYVCVLA
jgi:hypothetical protein